MINMETLFKNHFMTTSVGDGKMKKFTEDHLQRTTANNITGEFDAMLAETTAAYQSYYGAITDEATKYAVQQGLTINMQNAVTAFKKAVSQKEGIIKGTFGKSSAVYQEFYPLGIKEYWDATLADIEMLIDRYINAANAHVAELGQPFVDEFMVYQGNYNTARAAQLLKISEVDSLKTDASVKREVVETQLIKNLHTIGAKYPGNIERCMDFFDQSIIRARESAEVPDEEPTEPVTEPVIKPLAA